MAFLGYSAKLKRGLGLAFGAHFLHDLYKSVSYLVFYQLTKFQGHTLFRSQDIKQNVLFRYYLDS